MYYIFSNRKVLSLTAIPQTLSADAFECKIRSVNFDTFDGSFYQFDGASWYTVVQDCTDNTESPGWRIYVNTHYTQEKTTGNYRAAVMVSSAIIRSEPNSQ